MQAAPARPRVLAIVAVVLTAALLTSGCGKGDPPSGDRAPSERPSSGPSSDPSGGSTYDSATCVEVRAGIDVFNTGAYDETVRHFQQAVPLARRAAAADGAGPELRLLLPGSGRVSRMRGGAGPGAELEPPAGGCQLGIRTPLCPYRPGSYWVFGLSSRLQHLRIERIIPQSNPIAAIPTTTVIGTEIWRF